MRSSTQFIDLFRSRADPAGTMTFARFMQLALYDPSLGYYRQPRPRVGRAPGTDFFTASSSPLFGELVAAACTSLLAAHHADPRDFTFVEIGAEPLDEARGRPETGILANTPHPFGATKTFRLGDPLELKGRCVVFSNELFDAQPFHRFVFRRGAWRELGVALRDDGFVEVELPEATPATLPITAPEGYGIDAPLEAAALAGQIAAQPWSGLFLAFDYGKTWSELAEATPAGTARVFSSCAIERPPRPPRRAGPHLPRVLGLAGRRARVPRFLRATGRVTGKFFCPSRRRFPGPGDRGRGRPLQ
jgi:SAM-dependent MidA family methyltransferase